MVESGLLDEVEDLCFVEDCLRESGISFDLSKGIW